MHMARNEIILAAKSIARGEVLRRLESMRNKEMTIVEGCQQALEQALQQAHEKSGAVHIAPSRGGTPPLLFDRLTDALDA
jgi:hypothetical protein